MQNIGIYPNLKKEIVRENLSQVVKLALGAGLTPFLPQEIAADFGTRAYIPGDEESLEGIEAFVSLGGDGTLLRMADLLVRVNMPAFGVNFGRLGFLAEVEFSGLADAFRMLKKDSYSIENRAMLKTTVYREKNLLHKAHALNDIVVSKGKVSKMGHYLMRINGKKSVSLAADGIIVATATGSTAYSMSAGGPLLHPNVEGMVITPICPHDLSSSPLVIPLNDVVEIESERDGEELILQADGKIIGPIQDDCLVQVEKSRYTMQLLRVLAKNYYDTWQEKLKGEQLVL